jgi:hypothetical protein
MLTSIDQTVRAAIADKGYNTMHKYVQFLHWAFDGYYKCMREGAVKNRRAMTLTPDENGVCTYPSSVLAICKAGVPVGGRILLMTPDESLSLTAEGAQSSTMSPGGIVAVDNMFSWLTFTNLYFSQGPNYRPAVYDGSFAPSFRIDHASRRIIVSPAPSIVYLEVIESAQTPGIETIIPHHAALPMKSYIHYRHSRFKLGAAASETLASEREYLDELDEAMAGLSNLTLNGILAAVNSGQQFGIHQ